MKIFYDYQAFNFQNFGGISRYFFELLNNFYRDKDIELKLGILFSNNKYLEEKKENFHHFQFFKKHDFRGKIRIQEFLNRIYSSRKLAQLNYNIVHPTYYDPYFLKYISNKPFILTIYDMIHEKFPQYFSPNDTVPKNKKILADKATKIIAISENTKKDIIQYYNILETKIEVIHLGNSLEIHETNKYPNLSLPDKYILFVGSRKTYKNFVLFIESVAELLINDIELKVICVGGGSFNKEENSLFNTLKINQQIIFYSANDEILRELYKNALAFIFPSLYEGFGIPVLEAFACGCPLILSNISSLPEIAGEAAEYIDPYSKNNIKEVVNKVIYNQTLRKNLKEKGFKALMNFSWEKTASKTKAIYAKVLS